MHEHAQPASPASFPPSSAIVELPTPQIVNEPSSVAVTTIPECVICCDAISDPCQVQPCNHRPFDYLCVATWLFSDPRCPVCRAAVDALARDSTGELLTDFHAQTPTLNVHPSAATTSGRHLHHRLPPSRTHTRRRARSRCLSHSRPYAAVSDEPSAALRRRQDVYLHSRFSKHVGSNRLSRYRELTPQLFRDDEQLVSRARMWIRRELQVFSFLQPANGARGGDNEGDDSPAVRRRRQNAEFLLEYIIAILKSVDLAGSAGEAENMLSEFLGRDNTRLFLHELRAWLRSPYTKLEDWDRAVQYEVEPLMERQRGFSHAEQSSRNEVSGRRFGPRRGARDKRRYIYNHHVPSLPATPGPPRSRQ